MRFEFFWWDSRTDEPVTRRLVVPDETVLQCFWDTAKEWFQLPTPLNDDDWNKEEYSFRYRFLFGGAFPPFPLPKIREREEFNEAIFESRAFQRRMAQATVDLRNRKNLSFLEPQNLRREWWVGYSVLKRWCWEPAVMELYAEYRTRLKEIWVARWTAQGLNVDEKKAEVGWEEGVE